MDRQEPTELSGLSRDPDLAFIHTALKELGGTRSSELSFQQGSCPGEDMLWKYILRKLKGKEKQAVDAHLKTCDACRVIVAETVCYQPVEPQARQSLMTARPAIDELLSQAIQPGRRSGQSSPVETTKSFWQWGLGLTAPATALAGLLLYLWLAQPKVDMVLFWEPGHTVRSSSGMIPLHSGQTLISGTQLHAEIRGHRDGYIYLYLWSASQGGKFLFPLPDMPQDNRIRKGDQFMVPAKGTWIVDQAAGEEECLYLLYSAEPKDVRDGGGLAQHLDHISDVQESVEEHLVKHFSIEQKITYQHE